MTKNRILACLAVLCLLFCCVPRAAAATGYYTDKVSAADHLRQCFVNRETNISFVLRVYREDVGSLNRTALTSYLRAYMDDVIKLAYQHTGVGNEGDYLRLHNGGSRCNYSAEYHQDDPFADCTVTISASYYTTKAQEDRVGQEISRALASMDLAGKSEYEKIRAITDFICGRVTYDTYHVNNTNYLPQFTAYAALMDGTAVCQGYANLFYRMALEAGLDCRSVTGNAYNGRSIGGHAWNIVRIGDKYYNIDVTWMDSLGSDSLFLKGESDFPDHYPEQEFRTEEFRRTYPMAKSSYVPENGGGTAVCYEHRWDGGRITKAATCAEEGEITYTCSVCGAASTEVIPVSQDHEWTDCSTIREATCTEDGEMLRICAVCGATRSETIPGGHRYVTDPAVPVTCTTDGLTEGTHCEVCGEVLKARTVIMATGHQIVNVRGVAATCTEDGMTEGSYCAACGEVFREQTVIKAPGHKVVKDPGTAATCTEDGMTEGSHCAVCGKVLQAQTVILAGHRWDEGRVTRKATAEREGEMTYTCALCGAVAYMPIPKTSEDQQQETERKDDDHRPGDVDGNGRVTSADARLALRASVGLEQYPAGGAQYRACDADGDGTISSADARLILRASVGLEDASQWAR